MNEQQFEYYITLFMVVPVLHLILVWIIAAYIIFTHSSYPDSFRVWFKSAIIIEIISLVLAIMAISIYQLSIL